MSDAQRHVQIDLDRRTMMKMIVHANSSKMTPMRHSAVKWQAQESSRRSSRPALFQALCVLELLLLRLLLQLTP